MAGHIPFAENHREINGVLEKKCSIHEEYSPDDDSPWFPSTNEYFYKSKMNSIDGLSPWCKKCAIKKSRKSAVIRKEDVANYQHEYYLNNFEEQYNYRIKHAEEDLERKRNEERDWRQRNKNKLVKYSEQHRNHKITKQQWTACKNYFKNEKGEWCCAYCGLPISQHFKDYGSEIKIIDLHKEHVDHEGSNGLENCVPSCTSCNSSKRQYKLEDWYNPNNQRLKQGVYNEERYSKIIKWITEDYKQYE